jgi:hypothetical protein
MESRTTAMQDLLKAYAGGKLSPHDQEIIGNELRDDRRLAFLLDLPDLYFSRDYIKKIVGMDMSEFNGYQERADEFWRIFNEVNRNASDAQRVYKDFGRYIPVALLMDYIVPGAIRTMTGLLRTTIKSGKYNPQIVTRLIDGKRRVIMDEQMLLELEKVRDEIKETVQKNRKKEIKKRVSSTNKRKQKRIPALITMGKNGKKQRTEKKKPGTKVVDIKISNDRFYKIMDIAEGFVALNAAQSVDEVLGSFSSDAKEVNTVIDELHAKMTARFIELLARELDLDATNIPQTVKDKMYIPYMSRLTAARSRIEQREKKVKFLWFTGVVRSMMEGRDRFWKFIEDVDQDDQVGKAIASHNKKIRDLMADRKIDVARYLGREGKDRFAQGTFEHEGRTFTMRPILRDPGHDLFIGDFTNCCLAMNSDLNPEAMIERLILSSSVSSSSCSLYR